MVIKIINPAAIFLDRVSSYLFYMYWRMKG